MSFPSNPTDGQTATLNNVTYVYNSTKTAWIKSGTISTSIVANNISLTSSTPSTSPLSGSFVLAGGLGISGNINSTGNINTTGNVSVSGKLSAITTVTVDFSSTPYTTFTKYISDARAQIGDKVIVMPTSYTSDASTVLGGDELEMDNFSISANVVASGNIALYITAIPGPVRGYRNFNYILG